MHSINIRDHLCLYDKTVAPKQYLAYSDRTWKTWFENRVQYINRIQRSEWLAAFDRVGLELIEEQSGDVPLSDITIGKRFQAYNITDLSCGSLIVVHRKPE